MTFRAAIAAKNCLIVLFSGIEGTAGPHYIRSLQFKFGNQSADPHGNSTLGTSYFSCNFKSDERIIEVYISYGKSCFTLRGNVLTLTLYEGKEEDYIIGIEFYTYRRSCGIRRSSDTSSNRIVSYRCCEKYYRLNYLTGSLNSEGLITGVELHWIRD